MKYMKLIIIYLILIMVALIPAVEYVFDDQDYDNRFNIYNVSNLTVKGTADLTHSLQDAYDDGSVIGSFITFDSSTGEINGSFSAEDVDRDLPTDCPANNYPYAFGDNFSTWFCRADEDTIFNPSTIDYVNHTQLDNDTILRNGTDIYVTKVTTYNISSPYANKSYIFFQPDGSIGITLDPVEPPESPPIKEEEIKRTPSTETICENGKCNLILYSGVRFVEEDNKWKELWEARSLKNSGIKCVVESDGVHIAICEDFNYTHRRIKTSINTLSAIDKTKVPVSVYYEEYNEITKEIEIIEKSKEFYNFELIPNRDEWIEVDFGDIIKVGDKSTTIKLQEADTENLDDNAIWKGANSGNENGASATIYIGGSTSDWNRHCIKWNIISVPSSQIINDAKYCLYLNGDSSEGGEEWTFAVHHIYAFPFYNISDQEWTEGNSVTWTSATDPEMAADTSPSTSEQYNTIAEDTSATTFSDQTPNGYYCWNVTNMVWEDYSDGNNNLSLIIIPTLTGGSPTGTDTIRFYSKEGGGATTDPYLNITYSLAPAIRVTTTLESPEDGSTDTDGSVTFNCSAVAEQSSLTNITLYHNLSGWGAIKTQTVSGTSAYANFTYNIPDNTNLIWNCLASNDEGNTSFADANWSLTISIKNPKLFVQNLAGDTLWYVSLLGNMWLRNSLTVDTNTLYVDALNDRVGIGTTTPTSKLHVIGDLNVTGNITHKAIYAQLSDLADQRFTSANVKQPINLTTTDEVYGLDISIHNITILRSGVYSLIAQPQVATGAGGAGKFHMWLEKYDTTKWVNVSNSNVELVLGNNEENVIPLITTLRLETNEKIRVMGSVSDTAIILDTQAPVGEPVIPSIIYTMYKLGD